jgi:Zn-dependent alcohol dehydrogenase
MPCDNVALSIEHLDVEEARSGEVLVQVVAAGIRHTDVGMCNSPNRVPKPVSTSLHRRTHHATTQE